MTRKFKIYNLNIALLFCLLQVAGIDVFAQQTIIPADSLLQVKDYVSPAILDSLARNDSIAPSLKAVADSLQQVNAANLEKLEAVEELTDDPQATLLTADSLVVMPPQRTWIPDPGRATWLALVFPGGGQIYNRKYWKLPIIYGGFAGCAYALNWNNNMFKDYSQAYMDIMDEDVTTDSYRNFISGDAEVTEGPNGNYTQRFKRGKDRYRRYRDLSIFAFIGVYLISVIDAYVDAELSNFDIGPDLSMRIEPTIISDKRFYSNAIGVQWSIRF